MKKHRRDSRQEDGQREVKIKGQRSKKEILKEITRNLSWPVENNHGVKEKGKGRSIKKEIERKTVREGKLRVSGEVKTYQKKSQLRIYLDIYKKKNHGV